MISVTRVSEADFDAIIQRAGGSRYALPNDVEGKNADYRFPSAWAELKLIEDEGIDKPSRQRKLAELFAQGANPRPVTVLDPDALDESRRRIYLDTMGGPMKTAIKKAAKQLDATRSREGDTGCRVLIAINNGYGALSHDEFKTAVMKFATHDTSKIDSVVVGGIYNYTDDFDSHVLFPFEEILISVGERFAGFPAVHESWNRHVGAVMTALIQGVPHPGPVRVPLRDLVFEVDGVTYVKPAPRMGRPSSFWPNGARPRRNSSGLEQCPPVAIAKPVPDERSWAALKSAIADSSFLRDAYDDWRRSHVADSAGPVDPDRPVVPVPVDAKDFVRWCASHLREPSDDALLRDYAPTAFSDLVRDAIQGSRSVSDMLVIPSKHVLVTTMEVGQDKALDISTVELVEERVAGRQVSLLVPWRRMFHEHALALGAAHAIRLGVGTLLHKRNRTHAWE